MRHATCGAARPGQARQAGRAISDDHSHCTPTHNQSTVKLEDISGGKEGQPIRVINAFDDSVAVSFQYIKDYPPEGKQLVG